jgi:hypothetical protein
MRSSRAVRIARLLFSLPMASTIGIASTTQPEKVSTGRTMHESARPSATQPDVASVAMRIMSEREADHSDDYAALLDCLVRSPSGSTGVDGCGCSSRPTRPYRGPGNRNVSDWARALPVVTGPNLICQLHCNIPNMERDEMTRNNFAAVAGQLCA